jgi:hypothetical protein
MSSSTGFSTDGRETATVEDRPSRRLSTETTASFKTTEFFAYMVARGIAKSGSRDYYDAR